MWKRWLKLPAAWRQRLKRLATGALVAAGLLSVAWWLIDARLADEARRQADAGLSLAVAGVRSDWAEVILPTAIAGESAAAERAREVAGARIDRAVSAANEGSPVALRTTVRTALAGVRELDQPPTEAGARWAEWMVQRLADSLALLEREDRIALLIEADDTLATLAGRTRRRAYEPPPAVPVASEDKPPVVAAVAPAEETPPPPSPISAPPVAPEALEPEPLKVAAQPRIKTPPPEPQLTAREPQAWAPDWRNTPPAPSATEEATAPPQALSAWQDRELLAEYLRLADKLSAEKKPTSAAGPTSAPSREPTLKSETEARLEAIGVELASRGFRSVDRRHLEALLSPHAARRVALAERLLTTQTGDTARLLLVLAEDVSPEVRAAAISALGSSASRPLVQTAWELASQDEDPRVGRLAEPLRRRLR